jgi:hypothetical protein
MVIVLVPATILFGLALVLLAYDPVGNLFLAILLVAIAAVALYGTALIRWWFRSKENTN